MNEHEHLPDDLDALGRALERAAQREVRRRRLLARWRQGAVTVMLAVPLAIAVSTDDITPAVLGTTEPVAEASGPPSLAFAVGHIPDELLRYGKRPKCLDGLDCLDPVSRPVPSPAPEDKP